MRPSTVRLPRGRLDTLLTGGGEDAELGAPVEIGRYRIRGVLGQGGMGVVYEAYDPKLRRPVAIKLVREAQSVAGTTSRARARMRREAQALARLDHRNVIEVFDVGEHLGRLYIAMALAGGRSLREWTETEPRPGFDAIVRAYLQAGEGLAAAHEAGIAHRDFKPDNAVVDDDGRVRVLDFGLAHATSWSIVEATDTPIDELEAEFLTETGIVMGTPAYMAPEQHAGRGADAKSDQFSFCVSLWEALYGRRPFGGRDYAQLRRHVETGVISEPREATEVPRWLDRVLRRGLSVDPRARWPSMRALLAALRRRRDRAPRWAAVALVAVGLVGTTGAVVADMRRDDALCSGDDEALAGIWDAARRAEVEGAFVGAQASFAAAESSRTLVALDAWALRYRDAHHEACRRTRIDEAQTEEELDRQMACLLDRRARMRALVDALGRGDLVEGAANAARGLPEPEACGDPQALARQLPLPGDEALRRAVAEARAGLAEVRVSLDAGRVDAAAAALERHAERATQLGFEPLVAEVLVPMAQVHYERGDLSRAEATATRAYDVAVAADHSRVAHAAAAALVFYVGLAQQRFEAGQRWLNTARSYVVRGDVSERDAAPLDIYEVSLLRFQGRTEEALELATRTRERLQERLAEDDLFLFEAVAVEAMCNFDLGRLDQARALFERNVELARGWGTDHPAYARALANLAPVQYRGGDVTGAHESFARALSILEAAGADGSPKVADLLNNLAGMTSDLGDYEAAIDAHRRVLKMRQEIYGPDSESVAQTLQNLGNALARSGDYEAAVSRYRESSSIRERVLGPSHPQVGRTLRGIAIAWLRAGRPAEAITYADRALAIFEDGLGPDHSEVGVALAVRGEILLDLDRVQEALGPLQRALEIHRAASGLDPSRLGLSEVLLARAWHRTEPDPTEARRLAHHGYELMRSGSSLRPQLELVEGWVAEIDGRDG